MKTSESPSWKHTHTIVVGEKTIPTYNCDGVLYTRQEWESTTQADWEIVEGALLFQGNVPTEDYSLITE